MRADSFFIFSPFLDQSFAIAKFLTCYRPNSKVYGVTMPGESVRRSHPYIKKVISIETFQTLACKEKSFLVPTGAVSTKYCLETFGEIQLGPIILTQNVLAVYNKPKFLQRAKKIGVPVPRTWTKLKNIPKYPIFYKPDYEKGGGPRGVAYSSDQIPSVKGRSLLFQEIIASPGTYGVAFLAEKGCLLTTHAHFESISIPKEGGSAVIIESFENKKLIEYTAKLVQEFNYSGWGLAEFKYCPKRNDFFLMEINAKFWASCEFAFVNNPEFLKMLFDIDSNKKDSSKMIFVNRAFQLSFLLALKLIISQYTHSTLKIYPGFLRQLIIGLIPTNIRWIIRSLRQRNVPRLPNKS